MSTAPPLTEEYVREWCRDRGLVVVSTPFWVAAANAIRKAAGHSTSTEPAMTDAEAWDYIRGRVTEEAAGLLDVWAQQNHECGEALARAATTLRVGAKSPPGYVE